VSGVNSVLLPHGALGLSKRSALSTEGKGKTFDTSANGFVRREGCWVVVLKPSQQAIHDGDRVYTSILASMLNQEGKSNTLTASLFGFLHCPGFIHQLEPPFIPPLH
jgi:acyl transferase domain-containing protein